jgi:Fur family ferric uptake transcriptional regulator
MKNLRNVEILSLLKDEGYRLTKTRKALIDIILRKTGHWTIQTLLDETQNLSPKIGVATLYRTVALLLKNNVLIETRLGGGATRYEVSSAHHHDHLTCLTCGHIFEFENDKIECLQIEIAKELGFQLSDHRMELFGNCLRNPCKFRKPMRHRANSVTLRQNSGKKS